MNKIILIMCLLLSTAVQANYKRTVHYVVMPSGALYCLRHDLELCEQGFKHIITKNKGVYKADGIFRSITYEPDTKDKDKLCNTLYSKKADASKLYKCKTQPS